MKLNLHSSAKLQMHLHPDLILFLNWLWDDIFSTFQVDLNHTRYFCFLFQARQQENVCVLRGNVIGKILILLIAAQTNWRGPWTNVSKMWVYPRLCSRYADCNKLYSLDGNCWPSAPIPYCSTGGAQGLQSQLELTYKVVSIHQEVLNRSFLHDIGIQTYIFHLQGCCNDRQGIWNNNWIFLTLAFYLGAKSSYFNIFPVYPYQ